METRHLTADQALIVKKVIELHKVRVALSVWDNRPRPIDPVTGLVVSPKWSWRSKTAKALAKADRVISDEIMRLESEFDKRGGRGLPGFSESDIETYWMPRS